jgi:hypothetical protein
MNSTPTTARMASAELRKYSGSIRKHPVNHQRTGVYLVALNQRCEGLTVGNCHIKEGKPTPPWIPSR